MFSHSVASSPNSAITVLPVERTWHLSNPNVDRSSPPPPAKKKSAKKAPSKKPGKKP